MNPVAASLVLASAVVFATVRTNADDTIPPTVFPTIPAQAQSASDLVPDGWTVETEIRSDLNGDGVPDLMQLLHMTDPANVITDDGPGTRQLDTNPRLLLVAFADKTTGALSLALADHTLIPRHTNHNMEDPLDGVSVIKGTLRVSIGSFMTAGGWSVTRRKFTFRHQDGCFKLIGFDDIELQRNTGKMSETSINYLTKKVKISRGYVTEDWMNDIWKTVNAADLLCLEAVGDGLDFSPGLEPDSKRAAELLKAAAKTEPRWSTTIDSLRIGSGDQSAVLKDVQSTCNAIQLTQALGTTAEALHDCLGQTPVRVTVVFADGKLASEIEPDNEGTYCVTLALDRAHFDDLTCTFEANVSLP